MRKKFLSFAVVLVVLAVCSGDVGAQYVQPPTLGPPVLPPGWFISPYCAKTDQENVYTCNQFNNSVCMPKTDGTCTDGYTSYGPWTGSTIRGVSNFPSPQPGNIATNYGFKICWIETTCDYYRPHNMPAMCINPIPRQHGLPNAGELSRFPCFAP
jgi:hypothetical protein